MYFQRQRNYQSLRKIKQGMVYSRAMVVDMAAAEAMVVRAEADMVVVVVMVEVAEEVSKETVTTHLNPVEAMAAKAANTAAAHPRVETNTVALNKGWRQEAAADPQMTTQSSLETWVKLTNTKSEISSATLVSSL